MEDLGVAMGLAAGWDVVVGAGAITMGVGVVLEMGERLWLLLGVEWFAGLWVLLENVINW